MVLAGGHSIFLAPLPHHLLSQASDYIERIGHLDRIHWVVFAQAGSRFTSNDFCGRHEIVQVIRMKVFVLVTSFAPSAYTRGGKTVPCTLTGRVSSPA